MGCLLYAYHGALFSRLICFISKNSLHISSIPIWKRNLEIRQTNLDPLLEIFRNRCYSSGKISKSATHPQKVNPSKPKIKCDNDAFFVLRKGDLIGVYKNLTDCHAQVGSSICDPPVSIYKGNSLAKESKQYLSSHGVTNAIYSIKATDLKVDLFGMLVPCTLQGTTDSMHVSTNQLNRSLDIPKKNVDSSSCIIKFDGASKGNPGVAGAGAVLRDLNGSLICRLREGLGKATNNVAEYRAMILGLKYALTNGYTSVHVQGDSKVVCMQLQGQWKVKNKDLSNLLEQVKTLKNKFASFEVSHVLRDLNSEADAQANLGAQLGDGVVQEEVG